MKIFHLPDLGEGLAEAEVREWYVKEGDIVKVDQPLVSMETAKAVNSPVIIQLSHGGAQFYAGKSLDNSKLQACILDIE